jgi:hypothetical protein
MVAAANTASHATLRFIGSPLTLVHKGSLISGKGNVEIGCQ